MAVLLSPVGGVAAQFFTNAGVPLSGGKIYTYTAGTSTPQATYTTGAGNIQHSNPIVLDAAGRVPTGEIWLTDGLSYKFVLKDANDVLIATYDNIVGINSNFLAYSGQQEIQTATAGQTVFTLTTMQYQPGTNSLSVFVDGVNQYGPGAQYAWTETSSTVVTFASGLHVGASVKFSTIQLNNTASQNNATQVSYTNLDGTFTDVQNALDNLNNVGFVKMVRQLNSTSAWNVYKPDGTVLDVTGTKTSGLQEAINYAVSNGFNLKVYGGGTSTVDHGLLYTTDTVVFPPIRCMSIEFEGVHIESSPTDPTKQAMTINSCMMVDFKFNGEIVYFGTGRALEFHPTTGPGVDPLVNIVDSRFYIATVVTTGSAQSCVTFDIVDGSMTNSYYQFSEINANDNGSSTATTTYGIEIIGNDVSGNHFEFNTVICPHVHGGLVNVAIGTNTTNAENIAYNTFDVDCSTSVNGATGIVCLGKGNTGRVSSTVSTPGSVGFAYSGNAVRNCFIYKNEGSYSNGCSDKTANQLLFGAPLIQQQQTVSSSPWVIQNTDLSNWYVTIQGGTGVNIYTGFDGVTYYDMGYTNGQVTLQQGMYLKVVYSTAPTIRKFAYTY